ncbi:hypothetical protein [Saccharopolyspora sp. NPDC049426]|uniref:hypothetical protein n=1 Tax=Saccharopolyspora sp. NPDC049426 TaxID=3155652 RepID=UPI003433F29B
MLQTEVTTRVGTFVFSTARISVDQVTGREEYETTITEPCGQIAKPVRRCLTQQRARQVHQESVDQLVEIEHGRAEIRSHPQEQPRS